MSDLPGQQVVCLTRCIDVRGHTAMLVRAMTFMRYHWYPEYTVIEEFHNFNQNQYRCTIRTYPPVVGAAEPMHFAYGVGITINMAVLDAAYSCLMLLDENHTMVRETEFRYIPAALEEEEGYLSSLYSDSTLEETLVQSTAQLPKNRDHKVRALFLELYSTHTYLWITLT